MPLGGIFHLSRSGSGCAGRFGKRRSATRGWVTWNPWVETHGYYHGVAPRPETWLQDDEGGKRIRPVILRPMNLNGKMNRRWTQMDLDLG